MGEELRVARVSSGMSARRLGLLIGISHTQVRRIETGRAPHVDLDVLAQMAAVLGCELSLRLHPVSTPIPDAGHIALLRRFASRLHLSLLWRTEVPIPIPGDLRSADGTIDGAGVSAVVEGETRLDDVQAVQRRARSKQRDFAAERLILVVADTRHNRAVIAQVPELARQFPIGTRACLAALARGVDPGGDCLVVV